MKLWSRLTAYFGRKRVLMMTYLIGIGIVAGVMKLLAFKNLYHSSLLYVLVPYCISVVIVLFRSYREPQSPLKRYVSHVLTALSVLLSTSILIGEGFICIIFFAPIYLFVVTLTYLARFAGRNNRTYAVAFPILIVALSMEGTSPGLSMPRHTYVDVTRVTSLSINDIKANLAEPFDLRKDRHWLISIFPMPYRIDAGSLEVGDVHTVYTRYHRWFVANTHEGQAELLIEQVSDNKVVTKVLSDTTYFSTYLKGKGTEISFKQNVQGETEITLRLHYRRNLDPAWYFHPLQKIGVSKMAELIIDELMIRGEA